MEKLRGELWERRAVDGKLKSSLEWPNRCNTLWEAISQPRVNILPQTFYC